MVGLPIIAFTRRRLPAIEGVIVEETEQRVALVTGAAGGIGRVICGRLASAGFQIAACDLERSEVVWAPDRLAGGRGPLVIETFGGDVRSDDQVRLMVDAVFERFQHIDVLVNNAGLSGPARRLEEISDDDWHLVLETNLLGTFRMIRRVAPHMASRGYGRIINLASRSAFRGGLMTGHLTKKTSMHYAASKGAVVSMTRALAVELAGTGVTANCIAPAATETPELLRRGLDDAARQRLANTIPVGRMGTPEDVAHAVVYLATDAGFVTGTTLHIAGGDVLT